MKEDLISVIVPAYNIQDYIEKTVQSICAQTYKTLEIILVDDGSRDETAAVIDRLAACDSRIVAIHKENGGVTSARLCGIHAAQGAWIGFVDGDDYIEPDMYEVLLSNARQYNADISHCGYQMVFPSRVDYYYNTGRLLEQDTQTGVKDLLEAGFIEPCLCNKLFRRELFALFLQNGGMDTSIRNTEDLLMNFYLFRESRRSVFQDRCFYHYLLRKGSAATSLPNKHNLADPLKVLETILWEVTGNSELETIVKKRIAMHLVTQATMPLGIQKELLKPFRRKARKQLRRQLGWVLHSSCGTGTKLKVLWTCVWPWSYDVVHRIYARAKGLDRKYDVV